MVKGMVDGGRDGGGIGWWKGHRMVDDMGASDGGGGIG